MRFEIKKSKFLLRFTEDGFELYEIKTVKDEESKNYGNEKEIFVDYFSDFSSIYKKLLKIGFSRASINNFEDLNKIIQEVSNTLDNLLVYKGVLK